MDLEFINSYTRILFEDDYKEADEFKNKTIPEVLFKYFPCKKNRLDALFDQKLWLAQHETFNDPNEFTFMYIDHKKFDEAKLIGNK